MKIQKPHLRSLILFAFLVITLLIVLPVSGQPGPVASLDPQQGLVQYRPVGAPDTAWTTLSRVQLVSEGDWIRTANLGLAYLVFFTGIEAEILPNTLMQVSELAFVDADSPQITLSVSVGDMHHVIDHVLDAESRYEVHTPSAVIAVRGTDFWSSTTWLTEAFLNITQGILEIKGVSPTGDLSAPIFAAQNQTVMVFPGGYVGPTIPLDPTKIPTYPPSAPLAPATCGNLTCEPGETEVNCALDCKAIPTCGNQICELENGEGPVTCAADCVPDFPQVTTSPAPVTTGPTTIGQPCTIMAAKSYVNLRVGPGENRGVRSDLPQNVAIKVVGQTTDNQDHKWWKIQPPGYNPNEADRYWVAASDVQESGDCAQVPDAAASQLIVPKPTQDPDPPPIPAPGPELPPMSISFYADKYSISYYDCTTIYWDVEGIREVYYEGVGTVGHSSSVECPYSTTVYTLRVILVDGSTVYRYITITVI